jgi:hypothetical protein
MKSVPQKEVTLDELIEPGWGDAADYMHERCIQYGTAELMVPAIVKPQTDPTAATPLPTSFGELMQMLYISPGQLQMPQGTSHPGSSQMGLG